MPDEPKYVQLFFKEDSPYSDEEKLEILLHWVEFMKINQQEYGYSDEAIAAEEKRTILIKYALRLRNLVERLEIIATRNMETAAARFDETLAEIMDDNEGKPIPMFPDLMKKRGGN